MKNFLHLGLIIACTFLLGAFVSAEHGPLAGIGAGFLFANVALGSFFATVQGHCLGNVTIASGLKLDVLLDSALHAFRETILPVAAFSTVFRNVMLKGTDKVVVPYYPLEASASKDFAGTYVFDAGEVSTREVTVNKRKYQSLSLTSAEIARQPFLSAEEIGAAKGRKLAEDVIADILSIVTEANYGTHIFSGGASAFDTDAVADIRTALNEIPWPKSGRTLILDSAYDGNLVKDDPLLHADKAGTAEQLRTGRVKPFMGFERYFDTNMIPGNSENLVGMAVYKSAILTAFSPIEPAEDVRKNMTDYRAVTDPESGITLEYRQWGSPDNDVSKRVLEVNYGYAKGEANALKRIRSGAP